MSKKERESFGSTMKKDLLSDLRTLSEETGIPISKLLDKAVTLLLNEHQGVGRNVNRTVEDEISQRFDDIFEFEMDEVVNDKYKELNKSKSKNAIEQYLGIELNDK